MTVQWVADEQRRRQAMGRAIQAIRMERGLSRDDLRSVISNSHLGNVESGVREASGIMLADIARKLNVTVPQLFERAEQIAADPFNWYTREEVFKAALKRVTEQHGEALRRLADM